MKQHHIGLNRLQKILLICGILSSILYIGTDIIASMFLYPGYSYTSQQVSELSAIGAPTKTLWSNMGLIYDILLVAFAIGILSVSKKKTSLKITAILILVFVLDTTLWKYAPMHPRGTVSVSTDIAHIVLAAVEVLTMVLFMSFGAIALGRRFRIFSGITIFLTLAAGAFVGTTVNAIAAGQPTPWMGLVERVSVYSPMIWLVVFALVMLQWKESQVIHT